MIQKAKNIFNFLLNHSKRVNTIFEKKKRKKFANQHQLTSTTWENRYPAIFEAAQELATDKHNVLSYGCSTGEECFSIREYFPKAQIIGADINQSNLKKARRENTDANIEFITSEPELLKEKGPFDVIFAMSVLCRWEDTKDLENCKEIYSFNKFNESIIFLGTLLNKGGLLVVYNANFKVEDTSESNQLLPIKVSSITESGFVHKFDSNNLRNFNTHDAVIYRKG